MGMVSVSSLIARINSGLPASSQGITFLGWFDDLRTGSGAAGNHFGLTDHAGGGEDLDMGPGAGISSARATATVGQYTVFRTTGPAFAGFSSAVIVTETGLCGIAIVSDATNVRSYYKVGLTGVLTAGGTVAATSFTPASAGINSPVSLAIGNWAFFNRALSPWEIDAQLNQRALCIPDAVFYSSGAFGNTTTNETGGTSFTVDSGTEAAHAQDPGVGWRRAGRIYVPSTVSVGSGGSGLPAGVLAGKGGSVATAFGATTSPAGVLAGKGGAVATGKGGSSLPAALLGGTGKALVAGKGGMSLPAGVLSGVGVGSGLSTGDGGSVSPAGVLGGQGGAVAEANGGARSPAAVLAGKGASTATGSGGFVIPAGVVGGKGGSGVTGEGGMSLPAAWLRGPLRLDGSGAGGFARGRLRGRRKP